MSIPETSHESIARANGVLREADIRLAAAGVGITAHQYLVLAYLVRSDGPRMLREVAQQMRVTPAVITGLIDRMEKRRAIERMGRASGDRRRVYVRPTNSGRDLLNAANAALAEPAEVEARAA